MSNPWLANAADGATGERYEIRTVADFLNVPEERRHICLREFHAWMAIQEGVRDLLVAAGAALDSPLQPEHIKCHNEVFAWVDDGKALVSVTVNGGKQTADPQDSK